MKQRMSMAGNNDSVTMSPALPESFRGHYAGFVSRAIALVLDLMLILLAQTILVLSVQVITQFLGLSSLSGTLGSSLQSFVDEISNAVRLFLAFLSSAFVFASYCVFLWVLVDKTIGQALLGVRVIRTDGQRLTVKTAIKRIIGLYISAFVFFLGFLWVLIDDRRQGWHDKIAGTYVVYDWDARLGRQMRLWLAGRQSPGMPIEVTAQAGPERTSPPGTGSMKESS